MSGYDPEITPPWGTHRYEVPHADPQPAHGEATHHAPPLQRGQIDVPDDLMHALHAARRIKELRAHHFRDDPTYRACKPGLIDLAGWLWREMQQIPSHVGYAELYAEVVALLPTTYRRPEA